MDLRLLRAWYQANRRDLPWRAEHVSPWAIVVSEFMLQQTPVTRVAPAWRAWMTRWPTARDLAAAPLADVLRQWDRLGYPRRAKNLHECAKALVAHHGGEVPTDLDSLLALPGVGDYTARAVSCFAFALPLPVVDTNVKRVIARAQDGEAAAGHWSIRVGLQKAHAVVEADAPAKDYCLSQQALMELGQTVCTARNPKCGECPLASECQWRARGYPVDSSVLPRRQARYEGSDRQARGVLLGALREALRPVEREDLLQLWDPRSQAVRALDSLVRDGLANESESAEGLSYWLSGEHDPVE